MPTYDFSPLRHFLDRLTAWRIPGNAIVVYQHGKEVFRYSSGCSDLEKQLPMTEQDLVNIYSCSKVTTVTAALKLYEQGYFLLQDPLYEYIPEFRDMTVQEKDGSIHPAEKAITVRDLFTMTAGFNYDFNTPGFQKARELTKGHMNTGEVIRCIASDPLHYEPGTHWMYSIGHDVLAGFVEIVSGMRFADFVQKNIFDPLDMKTSGYHLPEKNPASIAAQYRYHTNEERDAVAAQQLPCDAEGFLEIVGPQISHVLGDHYDSGGAGITTSVEDYAKLCNALAMGGLGATGERILSPGTVRLMQQNQLGPELLPDLNWSQLTGYGYGLGVRTVIDKAKAGFMGERTEFGWGGAAGATVLVDTDAELSYFYAHHMLNPQETYYQPRLRNVVYSCLH